MRLMYKIKHISNAEYQHLFPLLLRAATFVRTDICKQKQFSFAVYRIQFSQSAEDRYNSLPTRYDFCVVKIKPYMTLNSLLNNFG